MTQPRAIRAEDKALRLEAILDAAERLWLARSGIMPSMAEIAIECGLGKGTLYLYFRSKEDLFLALHERHLRAFLGCVAERTRREEPMTIEDMLAVLRRFITDTPAFPPLASHGLLERHVPLELGFEFEQHTHTGMNAALEALCPHFPRITRRLMLQSYGLILSLWQLMHPSPLKALMQERALYCPNTLDYLNILETALRALWRGALSTEPPA